MIKKPSLSWLQSGGRTDCMAPALVGSRIPATTWLAMVWFVPLWRGYTRRLPASTFCLGRWQSHLMMWPVCCISPLTACSCSTGPFHRTRRWNWWRRTWGLVRVMLLKRSKRPKVYIADLATWRGSSRSVWRSRWIWKPSMVWLRRCRGCGTTLSAYICYTWRGSQSSLTRDHIYARGWRPCVLTT